MNIQTLIYILGTICLLIFLYFLPRLLGVRYIPHTSIGIIEKLWSSRGSLKEGRIIALTGEAGYQAELLRGGLHFGFFPWQYRVHKQPLVTISEGKIGYIYARDGDPLPPVQTLGRVVDCTHFQDARAFLTNSGQRGRQRLILREGVYALNLALFVVITEDFFYSGPLRDREGTNYEQWQDQLSQIRGFDPVVIGHGSQNLAGKIPADANVTLLPSDNIGVVSVQDGPVIESGQLIAPEVKGVESTSHNYFQDPEAFLALGGKRGKQLQVLTDGTFFINRWFATVETQPKTVIPIGYVGVVVAYYGNLGSDTTGESFRYGEQVESGQRGVWRQALPPGKYALNPYALKVELVPTVNFVLRWITGRTELHHYDEGLNSIELVTADAYEPVLPLSLVIHIDYEKASSVVQRFGDVKRLISQTLDPILTAYFRDVAQSSNMLDLLLKREDIQKRATAELGRRFTEYDINCVAVLIGRPESKITAENQIDPIEQLFDQLRQRRLAEERKETYVKQEEAANQLKQLNQANAAAEKQKQLTETKIEIEVSANRGEALLAEAQRIAKKDIALAEGQSRSQELLGKGEASKIAQIGLSEATVSLQKIRAYGDPKLFAVNLVAEHFARSAQPLVPERLFVMGDSGSGQSENGISNGNNLFSQLMAVLLSEKIGMGLAEGTPEMDKLAREFTEKQKTPEIPAAS
ncbi:MAG: SPFH domain-containing protein [Chthoniobacterales bacterium]